MKHLCVLAAFLSTACHEPRSDVGADTIVTTIAGSGIPVAIWRDGPAMSVTMQPAGIAVASDGEIVFSDGASIRRLVDGEVSALIVGSPLVDAAGLALDGEDNVIVADSGAHQIFRVTPKGDTSPIAGTGGAGFLDGNAGDAMFNQPRAVAVDSEGSILVADSGNHRIRKIAADGSVSTFAGSGRKGFADTGFNNSGEFNFPTGVAVDERGTVYVADRDNCRMRRISKSGTVTTAAGVDCSWEAAEPFLTTVRLDAQGNLAGTQAHPFIRPSGVTVSHDGTVYFADLRANQIAVLLRDGGRGILAGNGAGARRDGAGGLGGVAALMVPVGLAISSSGTVFFAEHGALATSGALRKIERVMSSVDAGPPPVSDGIY